MIRRLYISLLAILGLACFASVASPAALKPLLTHHVREVTRNGQAPLMGALPANQTMHLVLILPVRNLESLHRFLSEINDPLSSNYHHYLSVDQFTQRFGPTQKDYDTVIDFARANGFTVVGTSRNRLNIDITGLVSDVESAFHVSMNVYQHPTGNRKFYAADREPSVDLPFPLWHITGLDNYSIPRPMLARRDQDPEAQPPANTGSCPGQSFCGSDMRAAYYEGSSLTGTGQSVGLLEFAGTDLQDLNTYYANAHQTLSVPITLLSVDGTKTTCLVSQGCDDTVQTIDMSQALGMAPGLTGLTMYIGSTPSALLNGMATGTPLIYSLSSSWSWNPNPQQDDLYYEEMQAQGQTMFQASGGGEWKPTETDVWPGDNQYIESTGGTVLTTTGAGGPWASETAFGGSGGGISPNQVPIPSWQVQTAEDCVALGIDPCSTTLRNGPDVAANANYSFYVCADQTTCTENLYGGTSFSPPMWAGYNALANQQAAENGKPPVGFIDPTLYTIGLSSNYDSDFHDITTGSNGYEATVGYDLVTGWGTPNGSNLINALAGTGTASFTLSANPNRLKIAQGAAATTTVTASTTNGFDAAITLSSSLKTSTFNPNPIPAPGSGKSTMTISIGKNVPTGIHTITVTGTGGGVTGTTTVTVNVVK